MSKKGWQIGKPELEEEHSEKAKPWKQNVDFSLTAKAVKGADVEKRWVPRITGLPHILVCRG